MLTKVCKSVFAILLALQWAGCSTPTGLSRYSDFTEVKLSSGPVQGGTELGQVHGSKGGAIWVDCTESTTDALREVIGEAKSLGANAVGNLKWRATNTSTPSCKKGWGWVMIWPMLLTPVFMSAAVDGTAYKVDAAAPAKKGMFLIPDDKDGQERLVQQLAAGL